nr:hypothetical protein [Acetobacter garciniae]
MIPPEPFRKARVVIERHSAGLPDYDNVVAGAKRLLDCLTTPKVLHVRTPGARPVIRNKRGLGFIVDDSPKHIIYEVHSIKCARHEQRTVVTITEIVG